jgi:O-antigen/teichoic acid export membrane protein
LRARRSLLNFATVILFTVVTMVAAVFASPSLKIWLGEKRFGAFRVIIDWYGYLALLELGLSGALSPLLVRAIGQGDDRALHETVAAGVRGYVRVSLAAVAVGLGLTAVIGWVISDLGPAGTADLRRAWVVGLLSFLPLCGIPFRALVEAEQRGYRVNLWLTAQALLITAMSLLLAWAGWGLTGQAMAVVLGNWAFYLAITGGVLKRHPGLLRAVWSTPMAPELRRAIRRLSVPMLLITLSGRIGLMTDNTVIGGLLDTALVTTLFFAQRLATLVQSLLQGIGNATWATLADLHARHEHEAFNQRLTELTRLGAVLAAASLAPIVAYNRRFFEIWVHDPTFVYPGEAVILVAAFNAFLMPPLSLWFWCFTATGRAQQVVVPTLVSSAVNLLLSIVLTYSLGLVGLGLIGPLLGTALATVGFGLGYYPRLLRQVFGTPPAALARALVYPLGWGSLYAAGLWWVARRYPPSGWGSLLTEMAGATSLFLTLGVAVVLSDQANRAVWRSRLRAFLPA